VLSLGASDAGWELSRGPSYVPRPEFKLFQEIVSENAAHGSGLEAWAGFYTLDLDINDLGCRPVVRKLFSDG